MKRTNIICVFGLIMSILSIPLYFLLVSQAISLIVCIFGIYDVRKWNNKIIIFSYVGIVINLILLILFLTTVVIIFAEFKKWVDGTGYMFSLDYDSLYSFSDSFYVRAIRFVLYCFLCFFKL